MILLYASDSNFDNMKLKMENDLNILYDWLCANKLSLNINKTKFVYFGKMKDNFTKLKFGPGEINKTVVIKYLGIYLDENFKWSHHVKYISN